MTEAGKETGGEPGWGGFPSPHRLPYEARELMGREDELRLLDGLLAGAASESEPGPTPPTPPIAVAAQTPSIAATPAPSTEQTVTSSGTEQTITSSGLAAYAPDAAQPPPASTTPSPSAPAPPASTTPAPPAPAPSPPVCVVTGMAGVGKTSLVLHWAAQRSHAHFPDGALYADLRGFGPDSPEQAARVLDRFLRALDVPDEAVPADPADKEQLYRALLTDRSMLIILDNAASVAQVRPLLPSVGRNAAVVTSRAALRGIPGARHLTVDVLRPQDSIALLRSLLGPIGAAEADLAELAAACAHLPLALRIVGQRAARRPQTPLADLLAALRDTDARWTALSPGHGNEAEAVYAAFAWSYQALPAPTRHFFRLLGLHPGPDMSIAAAAALADLTVAQAQPLLEALADAHLVEQPSPQRYRMHDLVGAFARDRAEYEESVQEIRVARRRVLNWYLRASYLASQYTDLGCYKPVDLTFTATRHAPDIAGPRCAREWHEREWANLVCAVGCAADHGFPDLVWQLAATLRFAHLRSDRSKAGLAVQHAALASARRARNRLTEAVALDSLTLALQHAGRLPEAEENNLAAIALWHLQGDRLREAAARLTQVQILMGGRDWPHAIPAAWAVVDTAETLEDRRLEAAALGLLAECYVETGRFEEARLLLHEAVPIQQTLRWTAGLVDALWNTSRVLRAVGRPAAALGPAKDAFAQAELIADGDRQCRALLELATVWQANGHHEKALAGFQRATARARRHGLHGAQGRALGGVAACYRDQGNLSAAYAFDERTVELSRRTGDRWHLAVSLEQAADTLDRLAQSVAARRHRQEAYALFEEFDEPAAHLARGRLAAALDPSPRPTLETKGKRPVSDGGPDGADEVRTAR